MTIKEREDVIKALECCINESESCTGCPFIEKGACRQSSLLKLALVLINELTEEIKDLEAEYDRVYEQAEADIHGNMADGGTSCHWCMDKTKADTVKRMREMLNQRIDRTLDVFDFNISECNAVRQMLRGVKDDIYQVAKELTEDENDV